MRPVLCGADSRVLGRLQRQPDLSRPAGRDGLAPGLPRPLELVLGIREPDLHLDPLRARERPALQRLLVDRDRAPQLVDLIALLVECCSRSWVDTDCAVRSPSCAELLDRELGLAERDAEVEERPAVALV